MKMATSELERQLQATEEWQKAQQGLGYNGNIPEMIAARARCAIACDALNDSRDYSRRNQVELWRRLTLDERALPPRAATEAEDEALLEREPFVCAPVRAEYGFNIRLGESTWVNWNTTFHDTVPVTIGARSLVGPNCAFYCGAHHVDPALRDGDRGLWFERPIIVGEDCWIGGNVVVLGGVTIGRGCTIGAGSVVTRDVPAFHVATGNPARILRKIETAMDGGGEEEAVQER
ncbi:Trimeric LpxA-like protein [Cordyceps fumosorosea ARSEF 2679]|uniref:Trimeric LpxA-like protein n=1 Tax=Cordyceps fumosorosea (strain ARSEF 2679) TaxID=1081104 RepID=A0A162M9I8_CORFA|nr:Trimeric LpxA-like protein [Cordyceps fumosorosea ARSEF 2679]OAA52940.1 Trimeric LpxA-like protein [Cordyceps fumosorosea ARSEF 2679]